MATGNTPWRDPKTGRFITNATAHRHDAATSPPADADALVRTKHGRARVRIIHGEDLP